MRWNKTLTIKEKLILMVFWLFCSFFNISLHLQPWNIQRWKKRCFGYMKYIALRIILTVERLAYSCRWNTWIFFLHLLFLWFLHSWWCSQSILVKFLLFWKDKLFFFTYRILCLPARQVVGVSWQVIFLQWLWFLPYFQCRFCGNL